MNFNELISGNIAVQATEGISQKLGVDKEQTKWVISAAIPLMLSSINYNAKNKPEQAASLNEAIATEDSSSMFDNISSLFTKEPSENNNNIVHQIFGNNTDSVKESLAEKSGINADKIGGILALIAPLVMGYLGKLNKDSSSTSGGIGDILGNLLGGKNGNSSVSGGISDILGSVLGKADASNENSDQEKPNILGGLSDLAGEFFNQDNDKSTKGGILDNLVGMFTKK